MRLPDEFFVQCQCGSVMRIGMSFVTHMKDARAYAKKDHDTVEETLKLIKNQLCACGHMLFIHDKAKPRPCVKTSCPCVKFERVDFGEGKRKNN